MGDRSVLLRRNSSGRMLVMLKSLRNNYSELMVVVQNSLWMQIDITEEEDYVRGRSKARLSVWIRALFTSLRGHWLAITSRQTRINFLTIYHQSHLAVCCVISPQLNVMAAAVMRIFQKIVHCGRVLISRYVHGSLSFSLTLSISPPRREVQDYGGLRSSSPITNITIQRQVHKNLLE